MRHDLQRDARDPVAAAIAAADEIAAAAHAELASFDQRRELEVAALLERVDRDVAALLADLDARDRHEPPNWPGRAAWARVYDALTQAHPRGDTP